MPPAAARVVPRALKKIEGWGVRDVRLGDHFVESASTIELSFVDVELGARRVIDVMLVISGRDERVDRILEP